MKFLRKILDKQKPNFEKGGKLYFLHSVFDGFETFLFVPKHTTPTKGAQVRDAIDMKRLMITVVVAMVPCLLFGIWNVGHQHFLALGQADADLMSKIIYGSKMVLPVVVVAYGVGLGIEFDQTISFNLYVFTVMFLVWIKHIKIMQIYIVTL